MDMVCINIYIYEYDIFSVYCLIIPIFNHIMVDEW